MIKLHEMPSVLPQATETPSYEKIILPGRSQRALQHQWNKLKRKHKAMVEDAEESVRARDGKDDAELDAAEDEVEWQDARAEQEEEITEQERDGADQHTKADTTYVL
jgi:hypothetical protein